MNLAQKAKIKSQLAAKGVYWTDSQIEDYAKKMDLQPVEPQVEEDIFPKQAHEEAAGVGEHITDFIGSTLWNAIDTTTFGVAGWALPDVAEYAEREFSDTVSGRIGGAIGGLAGFMVPMGVVGRATSLAARSVKGAVQGGSKAIKAGKVIASPSTRQAQQMAAKRILAASEKEALKTGGKALTWSEAKRMAIESTDDIVGFTQKPIFGSSTMGKIFGKGPAYQMEHSTDFVNSIKSTMRAIMPERLAAQLSKQGINLKKDQLLSLSDEVVELLATKPFNSIETLIAGKYSGKIAQSIATVAGVAGQEAINFGIVGTVMDYVQYQRGNINYDDKSFFDRTLDHLVMGGLFGGVKFVPGGTNQSIMKGIGLYAGSSTKRINKAIQKMGLDETKALARMTKLNDKSAIFEVNGVRLSADQLKKGAGVTKEQLPKLKKAMIEHNKSMLADFRKAYPLDMAKDLLGSLPRMTLGSAVFNMHSLQDNAFEHLGTGEALFHLGLGALMTKGGRPLYKGGQVQTGMFHFGERPYYYSSDLKDVYTKMNSMDINSKHIGDIVKQFDGNLFTDWAAKNPIQDVNNIIEVLKKNDVAYDASSGKIGIDNTVEFALLNRELIDIISPVIGVMKSQYIEFNPNVTKEGLNNALKEIKLLKSESLSTAETPVFLTSRNIVSKSIVEGSQTAWSDMQIRLFDNFVQQMAVFTGQADYISGEGKMNDYYLPKSEWDKLDAQDKMVLNKLETLQARFKDLDIIKIQDFQQGKSKGIEIRLDAEKIKALREVQDRFEFDLGKEFYGESFTEPIDMLDDGMWSHLYTVDYHKSVSRVHDVIMGKDVVGVKDVDSKGIQSLINEILSHEENKIQGVIVESPEKIKIEITEGVELNLHEFQALKQFTNNLWSINAASGREASDGRVVKVSIDKVRQLKDELVKIGMPDPVVHSLDGRMQTWIDRAVNHGIENATQGLDLDPYKALAVKRLLLNGIITIKEDNMGNGVQLQGPTRITRLDIIKVKPNATEAEITAYEMAYNRVLANIGGEVLKTRENFSMQHLTENQLTSIMTADHIFNIDRLKVDVEKLADKIEVKILGVDNQIKVLESTLVVSENPTTAQEIRSAMQNKKAERDALNAFQVSFAKTMGGSVEITRASAHLELTNRLQNGNGKTVMDLFNELSGLEGESFVKKSEEIRDLQIAIANRVSERAMKESPFSEMRQEQIARWKHEEVEGHMPSQESKVTPEKYLEKFNVEIDNVFKPGEQGHNKTYDSAAEALHALYNEKAIVGGNIDGFIGRMFELAGKDTKTAPTELRNDVVHIANLFERRYNINRLTVNTKSGTGSFERSEMSKGFLTDIYSEIFGIGQASDMIILSPEYRDGDIIRSLATNTEGFSAISKVLSGDFMASLGEGSSKNLKHFKEGRAIGVDSKAGYYENIDLNKQVIGGRHYIIGVDENINLVVPEAGFSNLATSFIRWYEKVIDTDYVKKARSEISAADNLFKLSLEPYYKRLKETQKNDGSFDAKDFQTGYKNAAQHMEDSMFTMFNVMYGEKIDADWLQDAYLSSKNARRSYKYKRLAQNQGYSRNSNEKRQLLKNIYAETSDKRYRKLIDTYTEKENIHTLVIEDGVNSITGEAVNNFITDNRSVSEANLKKQYNDGDITESVFNDMMKTLKEGHSVNAAASNGMTAVNRDLLDYLLLLNGQEASIGHSAGQKPVGLSSYTDQNGVMHVFYNKTHYFYDSRLDNFFKNNKEIDQVAFTSGAKKSKIINPKLGLDNQFKPYEPPKMDSGQNIVDFINGISVDSKHQSVMPVKFDQTLSGTIYGKPHDARILKQFDNWSSKEVQLDLYEWSRADMARELASVNINLYNPEDVNLASNEARSFMRSTENKDGVSVEAPNASVSSIWMESGGVPFSEVSKNLYDALIKKRYIDNSGLFDGYTDAGGVPVLRSNLTNDLNIPVFSGGKQIKLGEANVGEAYLDRTIHFRGDFGIVTVDKQGLIKRDSYRNKSTLTVAFAYEGRDVIVNLKTNHVFDPYNLKVAKLSDYKDISTMVESLQAKLKEGKIEKYRDLYNELLGRSKGGESFTTAKGSVYTVDGTTTRRTKAARPEHPGDAGLKDKSTVTLYMEEITATSLFGKPFGAMSLAKKKFLGFNKLGVTLDGKTYGAKSKPKKGLLPVEFWIDSDGKLHDPLSGNVKSYHIGNKIVEIHKGGEFNYKGAQLVIMAMPAPRTGPHDAMVVKVKNILPSKDGGIMELNSYDVTMRGQRDYDTDKLPFYMDTPFSAVNEAYSKSGSILEALPLGDSNVKELDMYSNRSYKAYNQNIQDYKRKRGPIIKMHRKLTYAKRIFDEIGEIDLGGGHKIVFTENINRAMQSLVNDSQGVLDIYDGTPESMKKLSEWTNKTLFGNNAFFKIKTENGKETTISNAAHKVIVEKILNDFSNLLTLEGNIYEAGQAKQPRYQDMVSTYRDFQAEYSRGAVNWNFYHYMVKRGFEPEANRLFFGMDAPRKDAEMVGDVFGSLSEQIHEHPTPFMKSLNAAVNTDFNKTRETYSPSGDYFNKGIDELLGRHRANMLMHLQGTGIKGEYEYNKADDALEGLWKTFYKRRKDEEMGVQVNVLQEQIRRSEWRLSEMEKNPNADKYAIELQKENLLIKNESLTYILNKMSLEEGFLNQKIIKYRDGANNEIKVFNKDIVIRDGKTGKYIKKLTEDYTLRKNEVAVFDPVVLKSIVEHDLLDGVAFASTTLGYYSHVKEVDLPEFRRIVQKTKQEVKASMSKIMATKGYRDWSEHQARAQASIENGLAKIVSLANENASSEAGPIKLSQTFIGNMPVGRESYGLDFLMAMLSPDHSGNPNEYFFSPKTRGFMQSVGTPKRSVINAVFQVMDAYQVHTNHKEFIKDFARAHRGFYDALVAGRGFHDGLSRLQESSFNGALLKHTIDKALHNPFMTKADFKTIAETFENTPALGSTYAEMFRQMIQEGALTDPKTAFNIRKQIIETPGLGKEAYEAIFQLSRGQIVFDGLGSKQVGIHQGEGQLLGEVLMTRQDIFNRNLPIKNPVTNGIEIKDILNTAVGQANETKEGVCK